jgi:hypothetical protein
LDTLKYARDCEEVYGYFLHHFPYVGLRGGDDLAAQEQAAARMAVLYEKTFGEKYQRSLISEPEVASAYCLRPPPGAASAYCLQPTPTAARVYCLQPTPAYGLNMRVKQDETGFSARFGGTAFSTDPTETVADDDILMNAFFSTRPRLSAEVEAN